jgi:hypothetical protein
VLAADRALPARDHRFRLRLAFKEKRNYFARVIRYSCRELLA